MLYTGYTEHEIREITAILDRHKVPYDVSTNQEALKNANDTIKHEQYHHHYHSGIIDSSFYAITIEQNALKALPGSEILLLQELRIYPEMDIPYQQEEILSPPSMAIRKKAKFAKTAEKALTYLMLLFFLYLGLDWIDDYVYPIFSVFRSIEWL